jgi:uncharacterized membrane protein
MENKPRGNRTKELLCILIAIILLTDLAMLQNIPFLRQIAGFLFLTILPGLLILQILRLNKLGFLEKFILTWGLSISFVIFFGLLVNNLSLSLGYETPLATFPILISFNLAFIVLGIIGYKTNKEPMFSRPNFNLSTSGKAFLIVPILFPAVSIFGMYVMNITDNNIILMLLLFLIPIYVAFVCFFNHKFPKKLYPIVIFLISVSLVLLLALRSNYIIGYDVNHEYFIFRTILNNLHWGTFGHSSIDACLSISLLPTIYQSILNINNPEFLFKILFSLLYSISPLVIYVISKKYVEEGYAFLAACFYMFQVNFLFTEYNARTNLAILFFALAMMILFSDKIDPLKKRILFIVFMASCMVSHYATTYIFFFIMLGTFVGIEILSKKHAFKKVISLTIVILFFSMIFFWYSQVTEVAFNAGVGFVEDTLINLNMFFITESRGGMVQSVLGEGIEQKGIPHKIEFVFTWLTFVLIGVGIITLIIRYKEMSFPELKFKKHEFLKDKFEVGYFVTALACVGLLVAMVAVPYIGIGYNLDRLYALCITILSVFFVIGGISLSKHFFFFTKHFLSKERTCTKKECNSFGKAFLSKKRFVLKEKNNCFFSEEGFDGKNGSQVLAYLIILLVLLPYFLCVTGVMYNIFGVPRAIILNSKGEQSDIMLIYDQDAYAAKWFGKNYYVKQGICEVYVPDEIRALRTQCPILLDKSIKCRLLSQHEKINGYIILRYYNVVDGLVLREHNTTEMIEYSDMFIGKNRIYNNGGSEVWR